MAAVFLLLALLSAAAAEESREFARARAEIKHDLEGGGWNARVHAVHRLEELGASGLPLLTRAADDADWQVRMTAVHYLGRLGAPALAELTRSLEREPCRHVRLTALHWLGRMGPIAERALNKALEDESRLLRVNNRYWLKKMKGDLSPENGGDSELKAERVIAGSEDAKQCVASPHPGHMTNPRRPTGEDVVAAPVEPPAEDDDADISPPIIEPGSLAAAKPRDAGKPTKSERLGELDSLLFDEDERTGAPVTAPATLQATVPRAKPEPSLAVGLGLPEELAALERAQKRDERLRAEAKLAATSHSGVFPELLGRSTGPAESFGSGGAGGGRAPDERPVAGLVTDAGAPKQEGDPLPSLLSLLKAPEPMQRARAADEIGKLGTRGSVAVPALRAALRDKKPRVRASAALALGNVGESSNPAVPELVKALRDESEDVRASAAVSLARLPTPAARKAYRKHVRAETRALIEAK